jgi:LytS/YehU family sensor histidine kinase
MVPVMKKVSEGEQLWLATLSAIVMLIPKFILTYFIFFVSINKMNREHIFRCIAEIVVVGILSIVIYRFIYVYYVENVIYAGVFKQVSLWDIRRVLSAIMDTGFATGMAVTFKFIHLQLKAKEKEKNLVKEKLETELKFLRTQTNPHFLFNTLNNIYALARKKADETPEVVMKLSKLLRFMLYETGKPHITIAQEIKMMDDYIELEKLRYNNRLSVTFEKICDNDTEPIAPLLFLPFVENAFKHGVSETRFESFIFITMVVREGKLNFAIENTKEQLINQGFVENIGLGNVKRQLELMYSDYDLQIDNRDSIFRVNLHVNLRSYAKI